MNYKSTILSILFKVFLVQLLFIALYADNNWIVYDNIPPNATIKEIKDNILGKDVTELSGDGIENGYMLNLADKNLSKKYRVIKWSMRYSEYYIIYIKIDTKKGEKYIYYTPDDKSYGGDKNSTYIHYGLGSFTKDGKWRTFSRDIEADLKGFDSNNSLISIKSFLVRGSGEFDTVRLSKRYKKRVLILYDRVGKYGYMGKIHAMLLENLLGHFDINITAKPVDEYKSIDLRDKSTIFYLGTTYNAMDKYDINSSKRDSYKNFYRDIALSNRTIVWINYNLWSFEKYWSDNNLQGTTFKERYGFSFREISKLKYNRVVYKDTELYKGVVPYATPGSIIDNCILEENKRYACSLELNRLNILDLDKVDILSKAYSTLTENNNTTPYIINSDNFWFVGDIPFTYISEEDRYLAFADLLHNILRIPHRELHQAIMRLEDVDARTNLDDLNSIANYMMSKNIKFSVATIPIYKDPLGVENGGISTTEYISNSPIGSRLKELYDIGAIEIVQHGTTHQYSKIDSSISDIPNPYDGVSGDDFEFMRVIKNRDLSYSYLYPEENDSKVWAKNRTIEGRDILRDIGIEAFAWEAPHYMAGANHYRAIRDIYPVQYGRVTYYPNESNLTKENRFIGQFYPYIIQRDIYGYKIIPENIHNIDNNPNYGFRKLLPKDTIRFAKKLKVVRDGVASFYYHPYLRRAYLKTIIDGLEKEGYSFVSATDLIK